MKKKLIRGLLGLVVFSNVIINVPILVYAEKMNNMVNASLDEVILDAVSDDFDDIDNPLAKELLFPVYCLGKNIDEIEKYVDFGSAKIKDRSDTLGKGGKQYTFSKDLSNYSDQTTGSEVWMFNDMGELDAIVVNFFNRSDATNIEVLDNMKKVFGDDCTENKDGQKGIDSYDWDKPDMGIVQVYNYTGSDSAKDDGINSLTITFLGNKFTDAYKESLNDNSNNSTTADVDTIKKVQQALNDIGYDCGSPDGIAGERTKKAIIEFKQDYGLDSNNDSITQEFLDKLMSLQESEDVEPRKNIEQVMKELKNVSDDTSIQIVNVSSEDGVDSYAIYYNSIKYGIICNSDNNGKTTMAIMQMEESKDSSSIDFTFLLSDIMQAIDDTNKDSYLQVINTIYDGESEYNGVRYFTTGSGELKNITFYAEW